MTAIMYRSIDVTRLKMSYRESGPSGARKLLLPHGYPTAGRMFRELIPQLADRFHVVAPGPPVSGSLTCRRTGSP